MTKDTLRAALVQTTSTDDLAENAALCAQALQRAAAEGAQLVCFPEVVNLTQMDRAKALRTVRTEAEDPCLSTCQELAAKLGLWVHLGSLSLKPRDGEGMINRSILIDGQGAIRARYDKIHMFDVDLADGESYRESDLFRAGDEAVVVRSPWGGLGLTICYDLRFPYLHRALAAAGADILLGPAAFTRRTGQAHWHVLHRARAIETGCFVLAAAQCGDHADGRQTYGHSLAISPWGEILADLGELPGMVVAELDLAQAAQTRRMIPSLNHTRDFTVRVVEDPVSP